MLKRNSTVKIGRESGWWLLLYSLLILGTGWLGCWTAHGQEEEPKANPLRDQPLPNTVVSTSDKSEKIDGNYLCQVTAIEVNSSLLKNSKLDWSQLMPELATAPKSANDILIGYSKSDDSSGQGRSKHYKFDQSKLTQETATAPKSASDILKNFSESNESPFLGHVTESNRLMEIFDAIAVHGEAKNHFKDAKLILKKDLSGEIATGKETPVTLIHPDGSETVESFFYGVTLDCRVTKSGNQSMILELRGQFSGDSKFKHPDGRSVNQVHRINTGYQVKPNQTYALLLPIPSPVAPEELEREIVFLVSVQDLSEQE